MNRWSTIIVVASCLWGSLFAQTRQPTEQPATAANVVVQSLSANTDWKRQPEVIALEEQNKLIKQYHSSLLDTVYWSLSIVGGVAALLVGASYLINFKLYESDKERFNEKLLLIESKIDSLRDAQVSAVEFLRSELDANMVALTEKAKADTVLSVQGQLEGYADRASSEMLAFRSEVSSTAERTELRLRPLEISVERLQATKEELLRKIASVRTVAHEAVAETYDLRNYRAAKLLTLSQAINAAVEAKEAWQVKSLLKREAETLEFYTTAEDGLITPTTMEIVKKSALLASSTAPEESAAVLALLEKLEKMLTAPLA